MKLRTIVNLLVTAATASLLGSCAMDDILQQYTGTEIAFRPSLGMPGARSAEVGIGQLKDTELLVTAIDQHGDTYFKDVVFRNEDPDSPTPLFTSDQKYYWPGDGSPLRFTAYPKSYADRRLIDPNTGVLTYKPMSSWYKDEIYTADGGSMLPDGTIIGVDKTVQLPDGETVDPDGTVHFAGTVTLHPDKTIDFEDGTHIDTHRNITLPDGTVINRTGAATLPCGIIAFPNGNIKLTDGSIITRSNFGSHPGGVIIAENGSVELPDGTVLPPLDPDWGLELPDYIYADAQGTVNYQNFAYIGPDGNISFSTGDEISNYTTNTNIWLSNSYITIYLNGKIELDNSTIITPEHEHEWLIKRANEQPHEDLVVAHATGSKENIAGLPMTFKHLLSQIEVWAINNNPAYRYEIVNLKITRVNGAGNIQLSENSNWELDPDYMQTYISDIDFNKRYVTRLGPSIIHHTMALPDGKRTCLTDPNFYYTTEVEGTPAGAKYGSMMVLPQQLTAWDKTEDDYSGCYLAIKLRIYTTLGAWVYPERPEYFAPSEQPFGWVAVPLGGTWEAGKRYVYTLDFSDGAGYSDPEDGDPHPVLNGKFKFTLNVSDWGTDGSSSSYPIE